MTETSEQTGMTAQKRVTEHGETAVQSEPPERQSVEVRPMRYVLGIGTILAVLALLLVYALT